MSTNTQEHFKIDYAVGYSYEMLDWMVTTGAAKKNITVDEYLTIVKDAYMLLANSEMQEIVSSNDATFMAEMIDKMNDARCNWTHHDRYDFERKLKPEER